MTCRIALIGNSSNTNRGCEAIARGTLAVFKEVSNEPVEMTSSVIVHTDTAERVVKDRIIELGEPIQIPLRLGQKHSLIARSLAKISRRRLRTKLSDLGNHLSTASSVLSVGGDNYTLDYGRPYTFIDIDQEVRRIGHPFAIWGASIGPFSSDQEFELEILSHFRSLDRLYVRESISYNYLTEAGLTNVVQMADPAIFMAPEVPSNPGFDVTAFRGAIGLNLSPFQARQIAGKKTPLWATSQTELEGLAEFGAQLVGRLLSETERPILLVPHVMAKEAWNNDRALLSEVAKRLKPAQAERVALLPSSYNSPQLKWAMSNCSVFAGSRTHSTLGAISSGVPTLAFGYSRKATGLMHDIYGHDEMCLPGHAFTLDNAMEGLRKLLAQEDTLRACIADRLPAWRESTRAAARDWLAI